MNYDENPRALYELSEKEMKDLISAASVMAGTGPVGRTEVPYLMGMTYSSSAGGRRGAAQRLSLYLVAKAGLINVLREALGHPTAHGYYGTPLAVAKNTLETKGGNDVES